MKKNVCLSSFLALGLAVGCTTVKPLDVTSWTISPELSGKVIGGAKQFGEARLATVTVRAPYDSKGLVVLRPDGSVAIDPYNQFVATPSSIIKGIGLDVLRSAGVFKGVQPAVTTADVPDVLELVVDEIALDCRDAKTRKAVVKITLAHIRRRQVVACGRGMASVDAGSGDYSKAFGTAFETAVLQALSEIVR